MHDRQLSCCQVHIWEDFFEVLCVSLQNDFFCVVKEIFFGKKLFDQITDGLVTGA